MKSLWTKIKERLAHLRRAERIKKGRSHREKARTCFFRDPFKYTCSLLEEKKSGTLQTTKQELERYIKDQLSDNLRAKPLGSPGYVPHPPDSSTDTSPPRWSEVQQAMKRARATSAHQQGPAECGGENLFLHLNQKNDQLPPGEQVCRHQLPKGGSARVPWLCGTFGHDLGAKPDSQMKQGRPAHSLAGPGQCLWLISPPAHHICA